MATEIWGDWPLRRLAVFAFFILIACFIPAPIRIV